MQSVYHQGEIEVQQRSGEQERGAKHARGIMSTIVQGAIKFIENQPMVVISSTDPEGNVWVSMLLGDYRFISVDNETTLSIDLKKIQSDPEDILLNNVKSSEKLGCLFIELSTRRRFRINGNTTFLDDKIVLNVEEAYGNCPKYIQQRVPDKPSKGRETLSGKTSGDKLSVEQTNLIQQADTFFVGSIGPNGRLDASHRGGNPGFIEILENDLLRIPDYYGNSMYNTLGNFQADSRAGLLFVDFETGKILQLTGKAKIQFEQNSEEDQIKSAGTGRFWTFQIDQYIETNNHHEVDWNFMSYSPFNPSVKT